MRCCAASRNFAHWNECDFPVPLGCSEDVLVETFEEGHLISDYLRQYSPAERLQAAAADTTTDANTAVAEGAPVPFKIDAQLAHFVVSRGEDMYLKMLLSDNLMHADLHPGKRCFLSSLTTAAMMRLYSK